MRAITWLLIRWPYTVQLVRLERMVCAAVSAELDTRRDFGRLGKRSPNQWPPPPWQLLAIALLLLCSKVFVLCYQFFLGR